MNTLGTPGSCKSWALLITPELRLLYPNDQLGYLVLSYSLSYLILTTTEQIYIVTVALYNPKWKDSEHSQN